MSSDPPRQSIWRSLQRALAAPAMIAVTAISIVWIEHGPMTHTPPQRETAVVYVQNALDSGGLGEEHRSHTDDDTKLARIPPPSAVALINCAVNVLGRGDLRLPESAEDQFRDQFVTLDSTINVSVVSVAGARVGPETFQARFDAHLRPLGVELEDTYIAFYMARRVDTNDETQIAFGPEFHGASYRVAEDRLIRARLFACTDELVERVR